MLFMPCVCHVFASVHCCLVVTCWVLFVMSNCDFVTFPCGILGQVWYLIVLIPDICRLSYFHPCIFKILVTIPVFKLSSPCICKVLANSFPSNSVKDFVSIPILTKFRLEFQYFNVWANIKLFSMLATPPTPLQNSFVVSFNRPEIS